MQIRRPFSLSEGHIPLSDYNFLDDKSPISVIEKPENKDKIESKVEVEAAALTASCGFY